MKLYHWLQIILGSIVVKQQITFRATELILIPLLCPNSISPISEFPSKLETRLCGQRREDGKRDMKTWRGASLNTTKELYSKSTLIIRFVEEEITH